MPTFAAHFSSPCFTVIDNNCFYCSHLPSAPHKPKLVPHCAYIIHQYDDFVKSHYVRYKASHAVAAEAVVRPALPLPPEQLREHLAVDGHAEGDVHAEFFEGADFFVTSDAARGALVAQSRLVTLRLLSLFPTNPPGKLAACRACADRFYPTGSFSSPATCCAEGRN